jgi:hypothetical protein
MGNLTLGEVRPRVSRSTPVPIATAGWDASSPISDMPADRAIALVNMFPKAASVGTRKGWVSHATGLGATVESLLPWNGPSSSKLFGAAGTNVYDVTASGAVGAAVLSSTTNARWQGVNFGTAGGNFLWICNGAMAPQHYDGATWVAPAITGITGSTIINVTVFKRRLFFCMTGSLKFGYLPIESIAGAVSTYDLSVIFDRGGYLMAIGTWTTDGGAGPDDFAVFITSEGQAAVFAGTDPSNALSWGLVGVYDVGQPIGRRCLYSLGSDLIMLTRDGAVSLVAVSKLGESDRQEAAYTSRIRDAYVAATLSYAANYGWQAIEHAPTTSLIINIPLVEGTTTEQYVQNVLTGAWTRYTGLNAICWGMRGDQMYFGRPGGVVARAFGQDTDNGTNISWTYRGAFMQASKDGRSAHIKLLRPTMQSSANITASVIINADYADDPPDVPIPQGIAGSAFIWDESNWDEAFWGSGPAIISFWLTTPANGGVFSTQINGLSNAQTDLLALDVILEPGSLL